MGQAAHRHFSYRHRHVKGHAIVHLGRRRHGADDLTRGERLNLIVWNTNLAFRNSGTYLELQRQHRYEREAGPPDLVCLSYTHDRDFLRYKEKPSAHKSMTRRAWCPPVFAQHDAPDEGLAGLPPPPDGDDAAARRAARRRRQLAEDLAADDFDDAAADDDGGGGDGEGSDGGHGEALREMGMAAAQDANADEATAADAAELQRVITSVLGAG